MIPPNDVDAAARELAAIARDRKLRATLIRAGHEYVRSRTLSREAGRVAEFLTHHGPRTGSLAEMEAGGARKAGNRR